MSRPLFLVALVVVCTGCWHADFAKNAPGNIEVRKPPENPRNRAFRLPDDPGEQSIGLTYGGLLGGGFYVPNDSSVKGAYGIGPEMSVFYGRSRHSHAEDDFMHYPDVTNGLNFGWVPLTREGKGLGPLYLEAQHYNRGYGVAGGWSWDPNDQWHGPQASFFVGPLYSRITHFFDQGTQVHFGVILKAHSLWIWSL